MFKFKYYSVIILIIISSYEMSIASNRKNNIQGNVNSSSVIEQDFFVETIRLIIDNSDKDKEITGRICSVISNRIFTIMYDVNDSIISVENKMDLIQILQYYQKSASKYYRAILRDKIMNLDSIVINKPEFYIPFSVCYYCDFEMIDALDIDRFEQNMVHIIPLNYLKVYQMYLDFIKKIKQNTKLRYKNRITDYFGFEFINQRLMVKMKLENKYFR